MNIPISVKRLLDDRVVEQARIEYKESWNPKDILHTLCAFANDIDNWGGGYIVVGVGEEDGLPKKPVAGLEASALNGYQKELLSLCHKIQPYYMPVCSPVTYEGKHLLLIWAPGGYERPYQAKISLSKDKKEKAYYIRRFSNTIMATKTDIKELHDIGGNIPFDDRINYHSSLSNLRAGRMLDYLSAINSALVQEDMTSQEFALAMKIAGGPAEDIRPLNVGLMFFSDEPSQFFREAFIEVIDIPDPTGEGMTERKFSGPLDKQLSDALAHIRNTVIAERIYKSPKRAEATRIYNYPYQAIEEALSNAVYHKSYQVPEPITVRVEREQITITSFPGPDRSISDADLKQRRLIARRYRNRRIGDFLKELRLVEGRNTGIPTMLRSLKDNDSALPTFETDEERSFFSVNFAIQPAFIEVEKPNVVTAAKKRRTREQIKEEVLQLLQAAPHSQNEIGRKLGYSGVSKTLTKVIRELLEDGIVEYTTANEKDPKAKLQLIQ